jgi:hypothetical protein
MFKGQIEPTIAELSFGMFLRRLGVPFRYVTPSRVKTQDYDIHVHYKGGRVACGDIKCEIEALDYAESSVLNSLKKAQKQLPKDRPGIVFIKLPQHWFDLSTGKLGVETDVAEMLAKFFRTTSRVVLVVLYAKFTARGAHGTAISHMVLERENYKCRYAHDGSWQLFKEVKELSGWVDFSRVMTGTAATDAP